VRWLLLAAELPAKTDGHRAAQALGVPDWKAQRILENARRFSRAELRHAAHGLADIDVAVKTGAHAPTVLEEWLLTLTAPPSRKRF